MTSREPAVDLPVSSELVQRILRALGPRVRKVILFGSRARGDARSDSDVDLLVILGEVASPEIRPLRLLLYRSLRGVGVNAEPWVMGEEEFEETKSVIGGLAYPAATEGVLLYEKP